MLFAWTGTWRTDLSDEAIRGALARRATWQYPDGVNVIGEWWRPGVADPAIVSVFETDSYAPILEMSLVWGDVLRIHCTPAVTVEDGLVMGAQILQKMQG
ncbi:MAG TPA: DUF3303 domain-containing protein [Actinobacteria bacterium]|nr:hypothetical protein BMS3Bbin01_01228 [bacterium BMS3Bbin01]HDH25445.1 DUF3303 domain-containing protein [Actinomycetota bacterium]